MHYPTVAVQICTFRRPLVIRQTILALIENLFYPAESLRIYISDDCSGGSYTDDLLEWYESKELPNYKPEMVILSTPENLGWGANVNYGLRHIPEDYVFFVEDDYVLTKPLDLRLAVATLDALPHVGMIRYRGTAGERYVFHQFEVDLSNDERVTGRQESPGALPGRKTYLQLDSGSPSVYIYSHGPHFKRKLFHTHYGWYPEGMRLALTEESFAHIVKDGMRTDPDRAPGIIIFPEWVTMQWRHIGESYQNTENDK